MFDPSALEVPPYMALSQAGAILEPLIRNADWRQVLLDAIEGGKIEMRLQTANGGVTPLPANAILHLKPDDIDWANSRVFRRRFLLEPGARGELAGEDGLAQFEIVASEEWLAVKISRDDFMERFKRLFPVAPSAASLEQGERPEGRQKPHRPKGSSYDKPDAEIIELMRPLVHQGMMPTRAVKTLLNQGVKLEGTAREEGKIRRLVDKFKDTYGG